MKRARKKQLMCITGVPSRSFDEDWSQTVHFLVGAERLHKESFITIAQLLPKASSPIFKKKRNNLYSLLCVERLCLLHSKISNFAKL